MTVLAKINQATDNARKTAQDGAKRGRPRSREETLSIGVLKATAKRLRTLSYNLNISIGGVIDALAGNAPKMLKKFNSGQRRAYILRLIKKGKAK